MSNWKSFVFPKIKEKMRLQQLLARDYNATWAGGAHFEVQEEGNTFVIDVEKRTCGCK